MISKLLTLNRKQKPKHKGKYSADGVNCATQTVSRCFNHFRKTTSTSSAYMVYHVIENCQFYESKPKTNGSPVLAIQTVSITKMLRE